MGTVGLGLTVLGFASVVASGWATPPPRTGHVLGVLLIGAGCALLLAAAIVGQGLDPHHQPRRRR